METVKRKPKNKWLLIIGGFIAAQVIFTATDGTFLELKMNNMGNFANALANHLFFLEWITLYENFVYRLLTVLAILQIIVLAIKDITKVAGSRSNA
ncbi:hypothetical protein HNO89_002115 [Sporosarcina luteola]|nr:hypothetical protein [Sporosarcina luteola]